MIVFNSIIPLLSLFPLCNSARQSKRAEMMVGGLGTLHYFFPVQNYQFSINIFSFVTTESTTEQARITYHKEGVSLEFHGLMRLILLNGLSFPGLVCTEDCWSCFHN